MSSLDKPCAALKGLLQGIDRAPRSMIILDDQFHVIGMNKRCHTMTCIKEGAYLPDAVDGDPNKVRHILSQALTMSISLPIRLRHGEESWTFNAWRIDPLDETDRPLVMLAYDAANTIAARLSRVETAHESVTRRLVATETERDRLRRAAKRLRQLAEIDRLTELLNGETFMNRCNAALNQPDAHGMFVFVDLNNFKPINDRFGHDAGDHVLRTIATRLRDETRRRDLVARLGGDEFGLWLDGDDKSNLQHIVNNLEHVLTRPITWSPNGERQILLSVGASFGMAFSPEHGRRAELLKRHADLEMYRNKEAARRKMRA